MRIVAGKHKARPLSAPAGADIRPTQDMTRESLFNLLEHGRLASDGSRVAGAIVLDAFCGTGALGLEALSRGALSATLIDNSNAALSTARANAAGLGETDAVTLLRADARHPPTATLAHTLVFLDPPYGKDRAPGAIRGLDAAGWIAQGALIAVETGRTEDLDLPEGFTLEDQSRYGRAKISLVTKD